MIQSSFNQKNQLQSTNNRSSDGSCEPPYQELAFLFPAGALGVGVPVGLGCHADQLPLCRVGLRPDLQRPHHLLLLPLLPVLLDQTPLGHALRIVQHH